MNTYMEKYSDSWREEEKVELCFNLSSFVYVVLWTPPSSKDTQKHSKYFKYTINKEILSSSLQYLYNLNGSLRIN